MNSHIAMSMWTPATNIKGTTGIPSIIAGLVAPLNTGSNIVIS